MFVYRLKGAMFAFASYVFITWAALVINNIYWPWHKQYKHKQYKHKQYKLCSQLMFDDLTHSTQKHLKDCQ